MDVDPAPSGRAYALPLGVAAFALLAMLAIRHGQPTAYANYVLLADAWLHGHSWIHFPGDFIDAVPYHGRAYVVEGPAPAVLLLAPVALWGTATNQALFANLVGALGAFAAYRLSRTAGLTPVVALASTAFAFFGTSLFASAARGDVWFTAHVVAFAFSLLAIEETLGEGRPWLVAVYAAVAALSRFPLVVALPAYAFLLDRSGGRRALGTFVAMLVPAAALWVWYDEVRFGTIADPGFGLWFRVMDWRSPVGVKMFSLANVPDQVERFVFLFPKLVPRPPWIVIPPGGFSIVATSAPFTYALFARADARSLALWIATLATAIPAFSYYDSGQFQYGMRHALDFEPFLFALLVLALARRPSHAMTLALFAYAAAGAVAGTLWLLAG